MMDDCTTTRMTLLRESNMDAIARAMVDYTATRMVLLRES